jgi:1,2-diacylglycerol 3-alpha-glucosyltransferase
MRILLSSESYWPNNDGGAVFERRLVHQLIGAGHQVAIVAPGTSWLASMESDGESVIYRTTSGPLPLNKDYKVSYNAYPQVMKALKEFKPDIIHVHTMALTGATLLKQAKKRHIPIVATNHLMPENVLMSLPRFVMNSETIRRRFWKTLVAFHDKFLAISVPTESAAVLLREFHLKRPLSVISNGVNIHYYQPTTRKDDPLLERFDLPKHYFMYLGRVNAEKRIDMLIRSFSLTNPTNLHLVIAGTGNRSGALEKLATDLGIADKVHFVGRVTDDEKRALYQQAEFFAITSPAELQSIVTLEAAACGLPIIAVDIVALRELCHDKKNGFLIGLDDDQACANAIITLHTDEHLRKKFGAYSRKLVVDNHSEEATLEQYVAFYKNALALAKKPSGIMK